MRKLRWIRKAYVCVAEGARISWGRARSTAEGRKERKREKWSGVEEEEAGDFFLVRWKGVRWSWGRDTEK